MFNFSGGPRRAAVVSTEISDLVEAKNLKVMFDKSCDEFNVV